MSFLSLDTLDDVKRDFAKWRDTRSNKTGRIPNYLWDKVLGILDLYPIGQVTQVLGLSGSQVSAKRKQRDALEAASSRLSSNPKFVELNISSSTSCSNTSTNMQTKIEIRRPDGAILIASQVADQIILQILNQFTQAVR